MQTISTATRRDGPTRGNAVDVHPPAPARRSVRRRILLACAAAAGLAAAYLGGGMAQARCVFPFCESYHRRLLRPLTGPVAAAPSVAYTSLYPLRTTPVELPPLPYGYGSIERAGGGVLVSARTGELFSVGADGRTRRLDGRVPFTREDFDRDVSGPGIVPVWFGVKDVRLVRAADGGTRLVASYHHWDSARRCSTVRFAQADVSSPAGPAPGERLAWRQVFETSPCLPLKTAGWVFGGHEAGGRIEPFGAGKVLVTVGDHEFDGSHGADLPQDPSASQGKTHVLDLDGGAPRMFTLGHRNPQGLHVDAGGLVWSTEHGPTGGDELNLLRAGANYGWPHVTYGRAGAYTRTQGSHPGYERPLHAWVPSIGVSQLIRVRGDLFTAWRGDLLVTSLRAETLFRLRVRDGSAVLIEPIRVGQRIRDIEELRDGRIVLLTERNELLFLDPATSSPRAP